MAGRPLLDYVLEAGAALAPQRFTCVASPALALETGLTEVTKKYPALRIAIQQEPQGTAHALLCALSEEEKGAKRPHVDDREEKAAKRSHVDDREKKAPSSDESSATLLLMGDTPLLTADLLKAFAEKAQKSDAALILMTMRPPDPKGYGRCVQGASGDILEIVEEKDATASERALKLCYGGVMWIKGEWSERVRELSQSAETSEFYLTSLVKEVVKAGLQVDHMEVSSDMIAGVNTRSDLAKVEHVMQKRLRRKALEQGVTLISPETTFLSFDTSFGCDVTLFPCVVIGRGVALEDGVTVHSFSRLEEVHIGAHAVIGPSAHLTGSTTVGSESVVGSFVEVKRSQLGSHVKAKHLAYIGDSIIEKDVNVGAGAVTCNFDGDHKHTTHIEKGAFVGANTSLVAPLVIGPEGFVAAGSVITKKVPSKTLAITRAPQRHVPRRQKTSDDANHVKAANSVKKTLLEKENGKQKAQSPQHALEKMKEPAQ